MLLLDLLKDSIVRAFNEKRYQDCEAECQKLLSLDEFDEFGYVYLLEIYRARGEYSSAISLYDRLEKLLSEELFQNPSQEITALVQDIRQKRNQRVLNVLSQRERAIAPYLSENATPILGRGAEKNSIIADILHFEDGVRAVSRCVTGEAGIGKTELFRTLLHELDGYKMPIYQTCCYRAEENYVLKPWQSIFEQLDQSLHKEEHEPDAAFFRAAVSHAFPYLWHDTQSTNVDQDDIATANSDSSHRAITYALLRLAHRRRMILYFDDLQWADSVTISLIRDVLTSDRNHDVLFLFACRDERHQYVNTFLEEMKAARFIRETHLERFNFEETVQLADMLLPNRFSSDSLRRQLFRETEGNPFFIIETVNSIKFNGSVADLTPNMRDTIRLRIMSLPSEERSMLDLLSFFFDGASFELLQALSGKEEYALITTLEHLIEKKLVREVIRPDSISFQFTHQKFLEYVYGELSATKRRILHGRISVCLERQLNGTKGDVSLYTRLMYHYERAGDKRNYLKYYVEYVYTYLNLSHEYYPILSGETLPTEWDNDIHLSSSDRQGITRILKDIQALVQENQGRFDESDRHGFLSDYYHMMGRYHIRKVEYAQGEPYIRALIALNEGDSSWQCRSNMIKAYRQLICIYIDRYEVEKMRGVVENAFAVLGHDGKVEEQAIWMRLSGLCSIMAGDVATGKHSLIEAISIFEHSVEKEKYLFNLAASYAWLGEIERNLMHYDAAMRFYEHAISICTENYLTGGIATFFTYAGQASLDRGDIENADYYLTQAVERFSEVELMWGRGLAFAYYGFLCYEQKQYEKALSLFAQAFGYAQQLDSPYELGVLNRMFAQISLQMRSSPLLRSIFGSYIDKTPSAYLRQAKELLQGIYSPIDIQYIAQLSEQLSQQNIQ